MPKRLLFICYWSISDNLTIATVLPRLKVLQRRPDVEVVTLVTVERHNASGPKADLLHLTKITHIPFKSGKQQGSIVEKITDFIKLPVWLVRVVEANNLDTVLAHGSPAGALAYKLWEKKNLPFYVSSFEPHAAYMLESGVWKKWGLKYVFQNYWDKQQKIYAAGLMPVAKAYSEQLLYEGVQPERVFTVPCSVDDAEFEFDSGVRNSLRERFSWQNNTVGIYVGKFGDLYYNDEAFLIFKFCFGYIPDFRLIILTPQAIETVKKQLSKHKIDGSGVYIGSVPHKQVPSYLSASDFAFATFKPGSSKRYLSPVKIGEYWANGMPVLLTEGVGDDSDIIGQEGGGALFNLQQEGSLEQALHQIQEILKDQFHRQNIPKLAKKYRSPDKIGEAYDYFFGDKEASL